MRLTNPLGNAKAIMGIMKELSFDDVRVEAERPPLMLIMADDSESGHKLAESLSGEEHCPYISVLGLGSSPDRLGAYEAIVLFDPETRASSRHLLDELRRRYPEMAAIPFLSADPTDKEAARIVRAKILDTLPDRAPSFGRHIDGFRDQAINLVINDTAMANGQFALVANIPSVFPVLGTFATVSAEMLVLTKNQILLAYKISAIYKQELHDTTGFVRGIIPVAGTGFLWRTLAREAATFLPFAAGTVPKIAIAYAGTVAVGRASDYYFRFGEKPSKELMKTFYRIGMESLKSRQIPNWNQRNGTVDADYRFVDDVTSDSNSANLN